ncbi:hypothetical protein CR513_56080, partial [Mucuna pruriens]
MLAYTKGLRENTSQRPQFHSHFKNNHVSHEATDKLQQRRRRRHHATLAPRNSFFVGKKGGAYTFELGSSPTTRRGRGTSQGSIKGSSKMRGGITKTVVIPPHFQELVTYPFDRIQDPNIHFQAFQTQVYISDENDTISCKLFPGTLRGVAMQWFAGLPPKSIHTFNNLVTIFVSQFAANRAKRLEDKNLKKYLVRFNSATVQVNDPDQKFFVKAFQKGMRTRQFSDYFALRHQFSMSEIKARVEKHAKAEED